MVRALRRAAMGVLITAAGLPATASGQGSGSAAEGPSTQAREVRIQSGSIALAGSLLLPEGPGPHPAVVMISGSGPNDRYAHVGHFPAFGVIAERLVREGVAVLLLDRRGIGGSEGDWRRESIEGRAGDALAALRFLQGQPEIDRGRIGMLGHSQGGWVVQLAAARSPDVSFLVLMAGPGETVRAQILTDHGNQLRLAGRTPQEVEKEVRSLRRWLSVGDAIAPACRLARLHPVCYTLEYDPAAALSRVRIPVLALFGELDSLVPPEKNIPLIEAGLRRGGNRQLAVHVFPGANHQFWAATTGASNEYSKLRKEYVPGFLETLSGWVRQQTGRMPPPSSAREGADPIGGWRSARPAKAGNADFSFGHRDRPA